MEVRSGGDLSLQTLGWRGVGEDDLEYTGLLSEMHGVRHVSGDVCRECFHAPKQLELEAVQHMRLRTIGVIDSAMLRHLCGTTNI